MSSLPLEVDEVLEQEYVSMYGPLEGKPSERYGTDDILDETWARRILTACCPTANGDLLTTLNEFVAAVSLQGLSSSPAMTDRGKTLLGSYDEYTKGASEKRRAEINRRIVDDAFSGAVKSLRNVRLAHVYDKLHARGDNDARTALCISGGGIRSATFALGVIQGLASAGVLDKFDYLSTVSGGGYIGSWLSSWARRHPQGITGVQDDFARADSAVAGTRTADGTTNKARTPETKIDPEPAPIRYLREYSNYLSPKLGLASADTWTMASLYLRNLLLNLLVLVPIFAAVLAIPRLYSLLLRTGECFRFAAVLNIPWVSSIRMETDVCIRQAALLVIMNAALLVGFGYLGSIRPAGSGPRADRPRPSNSNGRFAGICILSLTTAATAMSLYWADAAEWPLAELLPADWPSWVVAILAMTVLPCGLYFRRVVRASAINGGDTVRAQTRNWRRLRYESLGMLIGVLTASTLLFVLAEKVFSHPLHDTPDLTWMPPFVRSLFSAVPMAELYVCFSVPLILIVFFIQASIFVGLSSRANEDYDREWWGRAGAWLLMAAGFLTVASAISVFGPVLLYRAPVILGSIGGLSGIAAALLGFSQHTPATQNQQPEKSVGSALTSAGLRVAVPLFLILFLAGISLATTWVLQQFHRTAPTELTRWVAQFQSSATLSETSHPLTGSTLKTEYATEKTPFLSLATVNGIAHLHTVRFTGWWDVLGIASIAAFAIVMSFCIGVNRFSMHALYRNRLIRAYLGASRYIRDPDSFTGFDPDDNLQMYKMRSDLIWPTSFKDVKRFITKLKKHDLADSVEQKLWNGLGEETRKRLERLAASDDAGDELVYALSENLNEILSTESLDPRYGDEPPLTRLRRNRDLFQETFGEALRKLERHAPFHIVNAALNLVGGEKLAWQERKAESFTISPLHSGSLYVGYRDSKQYGGPDGISLGTAVTISGAAASPNMGYHSSGAIAFLLTILNIRLGAWLGNPGLAGKETYKKPHPRTNLEPLWWELTGQTNDRCPLVYLSDGGHFENLALYEMVLRRCRYIVVSDAGSDPKYAFEDLGNAIRKIRTDLGVPIDIEDMAMFPRTAEGEFKDGRYVATATIRYSAIDGPTAPPGLLVYLKPGLYSDDYFPRDVYNYARQSPEFPHESTGDQFFSESQFESYRALGRHVINEICSNYPPRQSRRPRLPYAKPYGSVAEFASAVEEKARQIAAEPLQDFISTAVDRLAAAIGRLGSNLDGPGRRD
jgi:Patatin-like phospholipase